MKYYKHKDKNDVICTLRGNTAEFGKWVWNGDTCSEVLTQKEVTNDFFNSFTEISQNEFNHIWGVKLQNA